MPKALGKQDLQTAIASIDSLSTLNLYVRTAELRSFHEAGRQLGVSSSAVGKAVMRLEERLGVQLFNRSTRSMTLTQEGQTFLDSCRRILDEVQNIEADFAQAKGAPQGRLRVSLPLVGTLLVPTISRFMREYPDVELDMDFTDRLVDVVAEGFDVVVRTGQGVDSRLMARGLGSYRLLVVGSPTYFAKTGTPKNPLDLKGHRCLHHRYASTGKLEPWPLDLPQGVDELVLPVYTAASTIEPLIALAEAGMGVTCVPDFAVRTQLERGTLTRVLDNHIHYSGDFRAVWPSSRFLAPKRRVFVDYLAEHLFPPPQAPSGG